MNVPSPVRRTSAAVAIVALLRLGALAAPVAEAKAALPQLRGKSLAQLKLSSRTHQLPTDDDDTDGYEYGDKEFHARDADSSDYSVHQFITADDGRDGTKSDDDDQAFVMRREQALAKEDHFNSEETPSTDNFVQVKAVQARRQSQTSKRKLPVDDDDDEGYEYGDKEFHARDADSSDYSVHQFLTADDGRDGTKSDDDDQAFVMRREQALAKEDHFNSEETPSTDSFLQVASAARARAKLPTDDDDDDGDGYEYGDREFHARDADSSDYSVHQFLTADDGRDGTKSDDDDQGFVMRREQALAKEDHFNSEETPSTDNFLQLAVTHKRTKAQKAGKKLPTDDDDDGDGYEYGDREFHARDADSSDYSVHQFLTADDGRDGTKSDDDDQGFVMRREQALAKEDHFNSEETPSTDNFLQVASKAKAKLPTDDDDDDGDGYEYGDREFHARDADSSDYSVHQFLTADDGRDGTKSDDDDQGFVMRREQALAKEDHFNSEETPSTDNFLQLAAAHKRTKAQKAGEKLPTDDDDDGDGYEYGDREFHARDADSSDYSVHQFLTADDGRDGTKSDDDDQGFVMRREQALAKEDHFNSEETPSTDNFIQVKAAHATKKAKASARKLPGDDDDDDGYEYGDKEFHARDADSSDYSVHQFLTADDGRDGTKSDDDDQGFVMRREQALAKEDHFNSEETPSTDNFLQLAAAHKRAKAQNAGKKLPTDDDDDGYEYGDREFHARDADSSDYSVHQFLASDDGRDGTKTDDDDQAFVMRREQALAKEDHFNSEETPSTDNFMQLASAHQGIVRYLRKTPIDDEAAGDGYEYGDNAVHARDADSSDYSVHQFLGTDDGRDTPKADDEDQAAATRRSEAVAKADHFGSEDTPSTE